jgi:hypothetical protein
MPLAILMFSVASCAGTNSEHVAHPCRSVPLVVYTPADQDELANEIDSARGEGDIWPRYITDYARLRDMVRACQQH